MEQNSRPMMKATGLIIEAIGLPLLQNQPALSVRLLTGRRDDTPAVLASHVYP